jgi:hypothetical protein
MAPPFLVLSAIELSAGLQGHARNRALAERAEQLLIRSLPLNPLVTDVFRNLAFATCELSEQTGSARKTNRRFALT